MKRYLLAIGLAAAFGITQNASAATQVQAFQVTASVGTACTISVSAALAFGNYDPISPTDVLGNTTVVVNCTSGAPATIDLNEGIHKQAGSTPAVPVRAMLGGTTSSILTYNLYIDSAATTQVWGTGTPITGSAPNVALVGTGAPQSTTIYGRIPALQGAALADTYTDTVTATVTF